MMKYIALMCRNNDVENFIEEHLNDNGSIRVPAGLMKNIFDILLENCLNLMIDLSVTKDSLDQHCRVLRRLAEKLDEHGIDINMILR